VFHLTGRIVVLLIVFALVARTFAADADAPPTPARAYFHYAGQVVDDHGKPIADAQVTITNRMSKGYGYIDVVQTNAGGQFSVHRKTALSGATPAGVANDVIQLDVKHPDHATARIDDLRRVKPDEQTHLKIMLTDGRTLIGQVVDAARTPVVGAMVQAEFGNEYEQTRSRYSDGEGRFEFHGLPDKPGAIDALTVQPGQEPMSAHAEVGAADGTVDQIIMQKIQMPADKAVYSLWGMKLVDVDASLQKTYHLPRPTGVLVLDPGKDSASLDIGELMRGDSFWIVGKQPVKDFADFRRQLLAAGNQLTNGYGCRVVYNFHRPDSSPMGPAGTNTQYLKLTKQQVDELSAVGGL
jgi:hypothetical protein